MEYAFSIMMFAMAGGMLLYAADLAIWKNYKLIPRWQSARMKDPKAYTVQFAKVIAVFALPFLASGLVGLLQWYIPALIVLAVGFVGAGLAAARLMKDVM